MGKYIKPDFLCVGYQKSGTSWLHVQLSTHPELDLPFVKETHYLTTQSHDRKIKWLTSQIFFKGMANNPHLIKWLLKWYLLPASDNWYISLFDQKKICGEIAPTYVQLNPKKVKELFPNLKIIFLLREPVSRSWSKIKMDVRNRNEFSSLSEQVIIKEWEKIKREEISYIDSYKQWSFYFDQILVRFYDEISISPKQLYEDVLNFLGCKTIDWPSPELKKRINPGLSKTIPEPLKRQMIAHYKPEIIELANMLDSPFPKRWLESYEEI